MLKLRCVVQESTYDVPEREAVMADAARAMYDFYLFTNPPQAKMREARARKRGRYDDTCS